MRLKNIKGMYALVTGASSGIGRCYARELANQGYNLFIVSNQEKEIFETGEEIKRDFGVEVHTMFKDLTDSNAPDELLEYVKENDLDLEVLVNNAGVFFFNPLINTEWRRVELLLNLHIMAVTKMCHVFGQYFAEKRHGYILNMSSMSAWMTMPGINVYNSSKSYILNFSRSLWYEMKPLGVTVTAICPGAVDTTLYGLAPNLRKLAVGLHVSMTPERLVKKALKAMFKGKKHVVPGLINGPFVFIIKHLPDWFVFAAMKRISQFQK